MSSGPVADERLRRFGVTRSLQDRVFLLLLGAVQVSLAVFFLGPLLLKRTESHAEPGALLAFGIALWLEFLLALFALGGCCIVWGIATPAWLERLFSTALEHLWLVLLLIGLSLLVAAGYAFAILA
jgi:hypothetical protein